MLRSSLFVTITSISLCVSGAAFAASMDSSSSMGSSNGNQAPMMNSNDPASSGTMQNGTMQQPMPLTPSAHGGSLKDSAEADKQKMMMQQQNTN